MNIYKMSKIIIVYIVTTILILKISKKIKYNYLNNLKIKNQN